MKRLFACMIAASLAACFAMAGCAGGSASSATSASDTAPATSTASSAESSAPESATAPATPVTGGWEIPDSLGESALTDDQKETFEKAAKAQAAEDYEPIAVLATQVVAGQNIAYLCRDDATTQWDIVIVYSDPQHNASITGVSPIDLADIKTTENVTDGEATGAWEVQEATSGIAMTAEAAQAFSKATKDYEGPEINPLALLGTQVVAGTNYLILGTSNVANQDAASTVYVATVYEDLQGNAQLTDVSQLDLLTYVS